MRPSIRSQLHIALFLLGLFGAAAFLAKLDKLPFWSWSRSRYADAAKELNATDIVFFGSSRVHYGMVPAAFDEEMAAQGHPMRSYNLGISGQRAHDSLRTIEWALEQPRARLRYAIVELQTWDQRQRGTDWMTDQTIENHIPQHLLARLSSIAQSNQSTVNKAKNLLETVSHTAANTLNVGQGSRILDGLIAELQGRPIPNTWAVPDRGFHSSATNASEDSKKLAQELRDKPELAAARVATRMDPHNADYYKGDFNYEGFQRQDSLLRAAGLVPIYITVPYLYLKSPSFETVDNLAKTYVVLDFDNPTNYPQLFEPGMYFDPGHFNEAGAALFTRLAARTIVSSAQEGRLPALPASSATPAPAKSPVHGPK
jgi:hypothetical protein